MMMKTLIAGGIVLLAALSLHLRAELGSGAEDTPTPRPPEKAATPSDDDGLLDTMIGQMILVGFASDDERDRGVIAVRKQLAEGVIGGVVLYPDNIRSAKQLRLLTAYLRNANSKLVPFIAVDQEGGKVQRLTRRKGYTYFPSARNVAGNPSLSSPEAALRLYKEMAGELAEAGINLNFGPVVDLNLNPRNPVISGLKRSYGTDPNRVAALARAFILAHRDANIVTVAKHFPGHGSSHVDSHKAFADISKTWRESELEPYRLLAKDGLLDMVMIGHLYHPRFSDGDRLPASLSKRAIGALKAKGYIGFDGVVVSDDMEMGAVRKSYSLEERVVKAINAGTDLIVFSNVMSHDAELGVKIHAIIRQAVEDGRISRLRIEKAYGKIRLLKRRLMSHDLAGKW